MAYICDVFPPDKYDEEDAISLNIFLKDGNWAVIKNMQGFDFDGNPVDHTIWLTDDHCTDISEKLKKLIWEGYHSKKGIPFKDF